MYPYWSKVITVVASERTLLDQDELKYAKIPLIVMKNTTIETEHSKLAWRVVKMTSL